MTPARLSATRPRLLAIFTLGTAALLSLSPLLAGEAEAARTALSRTPARLAAAGARGKKSAKRSSHQAGRRASREVPVYTRAGLPNIQAQAALVLDLSAGGLPLFQKNPDEVRPIASISKLLAMLVVVEHKLDLEGESTITESDARLTARGAKSRLLTGMTFKNRDLLHAALMASDNRAVVALGRAVGLAAPELAAEMTKKARALGLKKTTFGDPTGLDYRNVSTPREVIAMLQAALKNPVIAQVSRTSDYVVRSLGKRRTAIEYGNTDLLLRSSRHVVHGGKTGYNDRAGYCLVVAARVSPPGGSGKSREVAMAFLGEEGKLSRFADFGRTAQWLVEKSPAPPAPPRSASVASVEKPNTL